MYHHASIVHWFENKNIKSILPTNVDIDLTNKCNQNCYYCISADFRESYPVQQKYTTYIKLISRLNTWRKHSPDSYGTLHAITFSGGGEPTLLKGYEKVIEYAIDCGFLVSLTTNGTLLDKLYKHVPIDKLKKLNWIGVDIDAGNPLTYESIRNSQTPNMFFKVVNNVIELRKLGVPVDFKVLTNEYNTSENDINAQISNETKKLISTFGTKEDTYDTIVKRLYKMANKIYVA